ncbi:MAG: protein kinase [Hyphomicrobiaceae bacterium]
MVHREALPSDAILDRRFRLGEVIGSGGFGITYLAQDLGLDTPVAIKEYFPTQFATRDSSYSVHPRSHSDKPSFERLRSSFIREARTLAQIDHPAVVRVLSVFETNGTAYMVMRYEAGPSMKAWLDELGRRPTQAELDEIVEPLLSALEVMHADDILHRDIAPDNIIRPGQLTRLDRFRGSTPSCWRALQHHDGHRQGRLLAARAVFGQQQGPRSLE